MLTTEMHWLTPLRPLAARGALALGVLAVGRYTSAMMIRNEISSDIPKIRALVTSAFEDAPHSIGAEAAIVDALRDGSALTISLVAEHEGEIVGHVAFSPIEIDGDTVDWYGLGPVAVRPDNQRRGIGVIFALLFLQ